MVRGALQELTFPNSWTKYGALSQADSAALFVDMFDAFCFGEGPCRMIGELIAYAGDTSPKPEWLICDGSEVAQADYPDLYAVISDLYGAASAGAFRLPDFRGRSPSGAGTGTGLSAVTVGEMYGQENHVLTVAEMPAHTHSTGNSLTGAAVMPGEGPVLVPNPLPATTGSTGGDGGHNTIGPRLGITYLIVAKDG